MKFARLLGLCFTATTAVGCNVDDLTSRSSLSQEAVRMTDAQPASQEVSVRVDQIGQMLLTQNPFLGVSPTFGVVGRPEEAIFHPDHHGILITEGLVNNCKTDDELAAVLALELAELTAEFKNGKRSGLPQPLPPQPGAGSMTAGGTDSTQLMTEALVREHASKNGAAVKPEVPQQLAAEILQNSGIESVHLEAARKRLSQTKRRSPLVDQLTPKSPIPSWSRNTDR